MPKKTHELQYYGVYPQNKDIPTVLDLAIRKTNFTLGLCSEDVKCTKSEYESLRDTLNYDDKNIDSLLIPVPEFFFNSFEKKLPIIICDKLVFCRDGYGDCGPAFSPYFARILSDKIISDIQAAIRGQSIFNWSEFVSEHYCHCSEKSYLVDRYLWVFSGKDYSFLNEDERKLLILEEIDKERAKFEKLKRKFSDSIRSDDYNLREPIPEDVRIFVWRRDSGKCVKCGSQEKLEYDHIIPIIKGGSNTARNIQLLCERCNRSKGSSI